MRLGVWGCTASCRFVIPGLIILACPSLGNAATAPAPAATPAPASGQMPEALAPFIVKGRFHPGNFEWLRWRYSADPAESAKWKQVMRWVGTRSEARKKAMAASLAAAGVDPARARGDCFDDEACGWVMVSGFLSGMPDWAVAKKAIDEARPAAEGYTLAVSAMERQAGEDPAAGSAAHELLTRVRIEQTLRAAMADPLAIPAYLSADGKRAWEMFIWREIARRDNENTIWLKKKVAKEGWPKRSTVGPDAAQAAWLLAQHADRDPTFQMQALRLMEPLVATREVSPKDYAFLYDRVFGELRGQQRYGTQMICSAGKFVPQPIEDQANLDKRRLAVGLSEMRDQLSKYTARTC